MKIDGILSWENSNNNCLTANFTKWSNTVKHLTMFDHFVGLVLEGIKTFDILTITKLEDNSHMKLLYWT